VKGARWAQNGGHRRGGSAGRGCIDLNDLNVTILAKLVIEIVDE
jgi:hypothetical protein